MATKRITREANGESTLKSGWCQSRQCDTEDERGECPIVTPAHICRCECHQGSEEPRGFLPPKRTR